MGYVERLGQKARIQTALYFDEPPPQKVVGEVLELVDANLTDLSMLAVPPSNPLYEVYRWALPCEVHLYIQRIGMIPTAPVELVVAYDDASPGEVVGFLLYLPVPADPEACGVTYMAVKATHRERGIGGAMMRDAVARYPHIELTCPVKKVPFYERIGFRVIDVHNTQVVMNTRSASTSGCMGIVDTGPIYSSAEVKAIHQQLVARWGIKAMANAEKQLQRHVEMLARKSAAYVNERLAGAANSGTAV